MCQCLPYTGNNSERAVKTAKLTIYSDKAKRDGGYSVIPFLCLEGTEILNGLMV
jgi:hypothetical protein